MHQIFGLLSFLSDGQIQSSGAQILSVLLPFPWLLFSEFL